ncbi:hypothetical protein UFOVP431_12 [uncultured Caudovirales phage]|uniref:Uncharacterized protein n=1 Tax=uncultured Caudovirales phage TaxID=2100421 RepID=A0A6J5MPX8_9CAUD|nr:hypothetical protein UFOVP431_12 [uncultured Caudovirales phage]
MNSQDFEHLNEAADTLRNDLQGFTNEGETEEVTGNLNEYGEIEDDGVEGDEGETFKDILEEALMDDAPPTTKDSLAVRHTLTTTTSSSNSWDKRSYLAINETDREFELFKLYCMYGGGRSLQYISVVSNVTSSVLNKLSAKNSWKRRAEDYDRAELVKKMKQSQDAKHDLHIRKLEKYRQEQEALGQQLTLNAARIALLANSTLSKMLDDDKPLDTRDLPGMLNVAAKLADVGKSLQSSALGVDNLLIALEEADSD